MIKRISPMKGKKLSEESKQKIRESIIKFYESEEGRELKKRLSKFNLGKKISDEHKLAVKNANLGKKLTEESKLKISDKLKGRNNTWFHKGVKTRILNDSYKHSEEWKRAARIFLKGINKGDKNNMWNGGSSFLPYSTEFNKDFKKIIKERDNYKCQICNIDEKNLKIPLHIHHIDYDKLNTNKNNCICLCVSCHTKTNKNRKEWTKIFRGIIQ
jgi:hypothetical protein